MVQRMADNDKIVTRYMDDKEFGAAAFTLLSKAIYDSIPTGEGIWIGDSAESLEAGSAGVSATRQEFPVDKGQAKE